MQVKAGVVQAREGLRLVSDKLGRLIPKALSGAESFLIGDRPTEFGIADFWRWSSSDLVSNSLRGVLAEFIVAKALGVSTTRPRTEWDMCDLRLGPLLIEVKSAAYLQSWSQKRLSPISFLVTPRRGWDAATSTMGKVARRHADVYVFALLAHQDKATVNPMDLAQWEFWILHRSMLDGRTRSQHSITLASLIRLAGAATSFSDIAGAVEREGRHSRVAG